MTSYPGDWWVSFTLLLWAGLCFVLAVLFYKRNW